MNESQKQEIIEFARQNLSHYNRGRLDSKDEGPILEQALQIERNKVLARLFPYRQFSATDK